MVSTLTDTKFLIGVAVGFFVVPMVVGVVRSKMGPSAVSPAKS